MTKPEVDPVSGYRTTGHEWNGIRELNTPVPRIVWYFLGATFLFSLFYWVLMPAWPLGLTYTRGLLGLDQRSTVEAELAQARAGRAAWEARILSLEPEAIRADPALLVTVRQAGAVLYGDNCMACHGPGGRGGPGFPALADGAWLWGGDPATLAETIRVGINSGHPEARESQMPAFGRDGLLSRAEILALVDYLQALQAEPATAAAMPGAGLFADNCAACHGEDARGSTDMGAPDLADGAWLYGGDRETLFATLWHGRQGHMPAWEGRLGQLERKLLALYLLELGAPDHGGGGNGGGGGQ